MTVVGITDSWIDAAPIGTMVPIEAVREYRRELLASISDVGHPVEASDALPPASWRERFWTAPQETRITVLELSEALARSPSWIYKRTAEKSHFERLPHHKSDCGQVTFVIGEVRDWLGAHEEIVAPPAPRITSITRARRRAREIG